MNMSEIIADFSKKLVDDLFETNFFEVNIIEKKFDMVRVVKKDGDANKSKYTCMICLYDINEELIAYKCIKCTCHIHHSCLNNYAKSYVMTNCIQCKHMNSSIFTNTDF